MNLHEENRRTWIAMLVVALLVALVLAMAACTDARRSQMTGYGNQYAVTLFSGGDTVGHWTSTGKVLSESQSDGYYFNDAETGTLIEVNGTVVIRRID